MLARLPSLTPIRLWAALLLAVIGVHAVLSAPVIERQSGSAFSAATHDVALHVQRAERAPRHALAPLPTTATGPSGQSVPSPAPVPARLTPLQPDSTGPPLADIASWDPAPRAPPRA